MRICILHESKLSHAGCVLKIQSHAKAGIDDNSHKISPVRYYQMQVIFFLREHTQARCECPYFATDKTKIYYSEEAMHRLLA